MTFCSPLIQILFLFLLFQSLTTSMVLLWTKSYLHAMRIFEGWPLVEAESEVFTGRDSSVRSCGPVVHRVNELWVALHGSHGRPTVPQEHTGKSENQKHKCTTALGSSRSRCIRTKPGINFSPHLNFHQCLTWNIFPDKGDSINLRKVLTKWQLNAYCWCTMYAFLWFNAARVNYHCTTVHNINFFPSPKICLRMLFSKLSWWRFISFLFSLCQRW